MTTAASNLGISLLVILFLSTLFLIRVGYGASPCWGLKLKKEDYNFCVLDTSEHEERVKSFNSHMSASGDKINSCLIVIDLPVGTAHGNHSYGGVCTLERSVPPPSRYFRTLKSDISSRRDIMVCDDEMLGRSKTVFIKEDLPDLVQLAEFVADNCYGG